MSALTPEDREILETGKQVLDDEAKAVAGVSERLGDEFVRAVKMLYACKGKVILTGIGKSGLIGKKIAATLSSTGTPSAFLHPTEGAHGDLGVVTRGDLIIAISKSGETSELISIIPVMRKIGVVIIALVGNLDSTLARKSDICLDCAVRKEACTFDLAPTSSTTAALAIGDALAIALSKLRNFTPDDFAFRHPAGSLGRRLLLSVSDLMHIGKNNPVLGPEASSVEIVELLSETKLGGVSIVDSEGKLMGLVTDGDIRLHIRKGAEFFSLKASDMMTRAPQTITPDASADKAYQLMEYRSSQISVLPVVDSEGRSVGMLRLHDVVGGGKE